MESNWRTDLTAARSRLSGPLAEFEDSSVIGGGVRYMTGCPGLASPNRTEDVTPKFAALAA